MNFIGSVLNGRYDFIYIFLLWIDWKYLLVFLEILFLLWYMWVICWIGIDISFWDGEGFVLRICEKRKEDILVRIRRYVVIVLICLCCFL